MVSLPRMPYSAESPDLPDLGRPTLLREARHRAARRERPAEQLRGLLRFLGHRDDQWLGLFATGVGTSPYPWERDRVAWVRSIDAGIERLLQADEDFGASAIAVTADETTPSEEAASGAGSWRAASFLTSWTAAHVEARRVLSMSIALSPSGPEAPEPTRERPLDPMVAAMLATLAEALGDERALALGLGVRDARILVALDSLPPSRAVTDLLESIVERVRARHPGAEIGAKLRPHGSAWTVPAYGTFEADDDSDTSSHARSVFVGHDDHLRRLTIADLARLSERLGGEAPDATLEEARIARPSRSSLPDAAEHDLRHGAPRFPRVPVSRTAHAAAEATTGTLLSTLTEEIALYVVLPPHTLVVLALWCLHTHALAAAACTPRLVLLAPTRRCGKSRTLRAMEALCRRSMMVARPTATSLRQAIEKCRPTLLFDDAFALLHDRGDLRTLLVRGYGRDRSIVDAASGAGSQRRLDAFAPAAMAAIGGVPDALADRAIVVRMRRRTSAEKIATLGTRALAALAAIRRRCARWAEAHAGALRDASPVVPGELGAEHVDRWRPLLAIAEAAGPAWAERARAAAVASCRPEEPTPDSLALELLHDIHAVFERTGTPRLRTTEMLAALNHLEGRRWMERPLTARTLAALLRPFTVAPSSVRTDAGTPKGYQRAWFADAFARFVPGHAPPPPCEPSR